MDIAEYGVPATWQRQMIIHGFDPLNHTVAEFVEFCERMEYAEADGSNDGTKSKTDSKNGKNGAKSPAKSSDEGHNKKKRKSHSDDDEAFCEYHKIYGHSTGECRNVLQQIKKMRANWETKRGYGYNYPKNSKSQDKKEKEDLHSLVQDMVKRELKQSVSGKKRKQEKEDNFNIEEFEDLSLSESDDDE